MESDSNFRERIEENSYPRKHIFERKLRAAGKRLENPMSVIREADAFFFEANGQRKISSFDETTVMVAKLMEQGLYRDYLFLRKMYTLPSLEFVKGLGQLIKDLGSRQPLEAGAGDGALSLHLKNQEGIGNMVPVDDLAYGGKMNIPGYDQDSISNRPPVSILVKKRLSQALSDYQPDLVVAAWLVNPRIGTGDDVSILTFPSVKNFVWIGDRLKQFTSSPELWTVPGWKQEDLSGLRNLFFTMADEIPPGYAFPKDANPGQIRVMMQYLQAQRGGMALFTRAKS